MRALYEHKSNEYWRTEIAASNGNMKRLWQRLQRYHYTSGEEPSGETGTHTADGFAAFFTSKVYQVRASTASTPPYNMPFRTTPTLDEWTHVTVEEVDKWQQR